METTFCTHLGYNTVAPCGKDCPTNQPIEEKCRKVAEKIVDLTGYGQALHVNDILPDLRELIENLLEQEKKRMSDEKEIINNAIREKLNPDLASDILDIINR